jgi:hypothetical protein
MTVAQSHQTGPIKAHWNDGLKLVKRDSSGTCSISLEAQLQALYDAPSKMSPAEHEAHLKRIRQHLNLAALSIEEREDLSGALAAATAEDRRKALVNYIKNYDVVRWATSVRAIAVAIQ